MRSAKSFSLFIILMFFAVMEVFADTVKVGLNHPMTGPYSAQGLDQFRAAQIAADEINAQGGILGKQVAIVTRDTKSQGPLAATNARELIDKENVKMIFGGVSSGVAVAVNDVAQEKGHLFMGTVTASNATTGERGHRHNFRVSYNAWMGAKALSTYLNKKYSGKKYFYITADYTWGWSSEASMRKFTNTEDKSKNQGVLTPFPGATNDDFRQALSRAKEANPDVLVLVLFGQDMSTAIRLATLKGMKRKMQIVVPILELNLAEGAGPKVMEGVMGSSDWNWKVPYKYDYQNGKAFIEKFARLYKRYPGWGASTSYTNLWEYKNAVEKVGSFETSSVIKALENHEFTLLKGTQRWRDFDHQNVQDVYVVRCKSARDVVGDKFKLDYFEILAEIPGEEVVQTRAEWNARRTKAGLATHLESL